MPKNSLLGATFYFCHEYHCDAVGCLGNTYFSLPDGPEEYHSSLLLDVYQYYILSC